MQGIVAAHLEKLNIDAERSSNDVLFPQEELIDCHSTRPPYMLHSQENGTSWNPLRETVA